MTSARRRVFVASSAPDGILAFDWDSATATLTPAGVAANVPNVAWLALSGEFVFSASELDTFEGKPTGEVSSFRVVDGELQPISARNSAGTGTCHVAVDATGRMLLAADRLSTSRDSISNISASLGYESESAFSTAFKRVMGCSPREYSRRRNLRPDRAKQLAAVAS